MANYSMRLQLNGKTTTTTKLINVFLNSVHEAECQPAHRIVWITLTYEKSAFLTSFTSMLFCLSVLFDFIQFRMP